MREYELVVILSPMLNQEQSAESWDRIKGFISNRDAEIIHEEKWGTRRLAYPIRKGQHQFLEGTYHLTRFNTQRPFNQELETFLRLDDQVIRSMVVIAPLPQDQPARTPGTPMPAPVVEPAAPPAEAVAVVEGEPAEAAVAEETAAEAEVLLARVDLSSGRHRV